MYSYFMKNIVLITFIHLPHLVKGVSVHFQMIISTSSCDFSPECFYYIPGITFFLVYKSTGYIGWGEF